MNQCQVILDNKLQCPNPAYMSNSGHDYCRLHFSYILAKIADSLQNPKALNPDDYCQLHFSYMLAKITDSLQNTRALNPNDDKDIKEMLEHQKKAKELESAAVQKGPEQASKEFQNREQKPDK